MTEAAEIPSQFTHSVKLSETAKGIRIDVHIYANSQEDAVVEAINTYLLTREMCEHKEIPLAPFEVAKT
jgi:hypothetical protein